MKIKILFLAACCIIPPVTGLLAVSLRISQIDSARLLFNQDIRLYLSVTDNTGEPIEGLKQDHFQILESADGHEYQAIKEMNSFQTGTNYEQGINFLLLIDNSESMYWTMAGEKTANPDERRMTKARNAVKAFLKSITNPKDKIGISTYNSYYHPLSPPIDDKNQIEEYLERIDRPSGDAIYSEIYGSLYLAVDEFRRNRGRKAIIILSDGVNNPFFQHTQRINPQFGEPYVSFQKPLKALQTEGISLYVIYFGKRGEQQDRNLLEIATESGGVTFNAHNEAELKDVYLKIMDQILKEYVITYDATMIPAERKHVKVRFIRDRQRRTATRFYFASPVFGQPPDRPHYWVLIALLVAGLLLWRLTKIRFERPASRPNIEILNTGGGNVSTRVLSLDNAQTVIGSSPQSDMTIAGLAAIEDHHATIIFEEKQKRYRLTGQGKMMVNNQQVQTRILEAGDLIDINGVTMVFDDGRSGG